NMEVHLYVSVASVPSVVIFGRREERWSVGSIFVNDPPRDTKTHERAASSCPSCPSWIKKTEYLTDVLAPIPFKYAALSPHPPSSPPPALRLSPTRGEGVPHQDALSPSPRRGRGGRG